jgi:hypothetical protein
LPPRLFNLMLELNENKKLINAISTVQIRRDF